MSVTVLKKEKNELRLRIIGESHTALQVLRERLNAHKDVDYANYFPGHPELDDPEFYIRTTSKAGVDKVLNDIISGVASFFASGRGPKLPLCQRQATRRSATLLASI